MEELWRRNKFVLLTSEVQISELKRVTHYPDIRQRIILQAAGARLKLLRLDAVFVNHKIVPGLSSDPDDDFLFTIAKYGEADYLVNWGPPGCS